MKGRPLPIGQTWNTVIFSQASKNYCWTEVPANSAAISVGLMPTGLKLSVDLADSCSASENVFNYAIH